MSVLGLCNTVSLQQFAPQRQYILVSDRPHSRTRPTLVKIKSSKSSFSGFVCLTPIYDALLIASFRSVSVFLCDRRKLTCFRRQLVYLKMIFHIHYTCNVTCCFLVNETRITNQSTSKKFSQQKQSSGVFFFYSSISNNCVKYKCKL